MKTKLTMKALFIDAADGAFTARDVEIPTPGPDEVLVKIAASGVNPLDIKIRQGNASHARHTLPAILGMDMAGTIVQVGENISEYKPGDEVFGMVGGVGNIPGTLAEYAAVDANLIAHKPHTMSFTEAAALPLIAITAWEGLVDRAKVSKGDKVLVHGGAGGVGHIAVQLAKANGAGVFATVSSDDIGLPAQYGATAINYEAESVEDYLSKYTGGIGFDIIYDTVGGDALDKSFAAVRARGHVISCLGRGTHSLAPLSLKGASYSGVFTLLPLLTGVGRAHHGHILREAARLYQAGQLKVRLDSNHYSFLEVEKAHVAILNKKTDGKVVIVL